MLNDNNKSRLHFFNTEQGISVVVIARKPFFIATIMVVLGLIILTAVLATAAGMLYMVWDKLPVTTLFLMFVPFSLFPVAMGFLLVRGLIWGYTGQETIAIRQGMLDITRTGDIYFKPRRFQLDACRNFRLEIISVGRSPSIKHGHIVFEYHGKTQYTGRALSPAEAQAILDFLTKNNAIPNA